jgi:dihydrofolate reductase
VTVYFDVSTSLDGFVAGPNVRPDNPMGDGGERLHDWMFVGKTADQSRAWEESVFAPVGALVMGRRMLDLGIGPWGDNPTFHAPVFVVTHDPHEPIVKDGGTTYTFVTGGLEPALVLARAAASERDIAIAGGADLIRQCLATGVIDEMRLHFVPMLLGAGVRLFEGADLPVTDLETISVESASGVVHVRYRLPDR